MEEHLGITAKAHYICRARAGLKQNADIVAVEDNVIEKRTIKNFKTKWLGRSELESVLENAITFARKKRKVRPASCGANQGYFGRIILLK
jgi:hypothetical protein